MCATQCKVQQVKEESDNMSSSDGSPIPNQSYDLVSVLYHVLKGTRTYSMYIRDAQQTGDQELVQFFQDVQAQDQQRATRAQQLLQKRLGSGIQGMTSQGAMQSASTQG
jgi:hypothetical protein